jgi:Flp pilus assembly protein TadG
MSEIQPMGGKMLARRFLKDTCGHYAMMTAVLLVPLFGALALGVDYTEMTRQRNVTLQALDAAGVATARRILEGVSDEEAKAYAQEFFEANLGSLNRANATLTVTLPDRNGQGGETVKLHASMNYKPFFLPSFILGGNGDAPPELLRFDARTEVRLRSTLEVALVLDNSGSMDIIGTGSGRKRMDLLKEAATELVETLAEQARQMKQVNEPVRFSVVPFAASVNVGPQNANQNWMDRDGRSPIHHENFNWGTMGQHDPNRRVELDAGVYRKKGSGWGDQENQIVSRFTLFDAIRRTSGTAYTSWGGCVETRPGNYAYDTTPPNPANPATLFVPMFAPDETDRSDRGREAWNSYWPDMMSGSNDAARQAYMPKYFVPHDRAPFNVHQFEGPNSMCTTAAITPLTDVTTDTGLNRIKQAIDGMYASGGTDIPEGTAWGWRTVTSTAPFTEARPEQERGNDKVVIVLTDGFNTYYTPGSLGRNDLANNRSIYDNQGYTGVNYSGANRTRLYMNTTVNTGTHTNANFTAAMNQHLDRVCQQAKDAGVIVMTVALDLSSSVANERDAIEAMRRCASESRFRRGADGNPAKLFWNANGGNLGDSFREIADELSNLRIVG